LKKSFLLILLIFTSLIFAQPKESKIAVMPGAFSRFGFGARGIGMGNAMTAVTEGNLVSYYNPALSVFQDDNSFQSSYTFLALDRSLNFISFTRRFEIGGNKNKAAGISAGIINSGVNKIDGRDGDGNKTGDLSTSENQFFLALAKRFSEKFSVGVEAKFYYYKLYESVNASGVGVDIGFLYKINEQWNIAANFVDINSAYKWDTSPIYGTDGTVTNVKFPMLRRFAVSYLNKDIGLLASLEFENSTGQTNIIKAGVEYNIYDALYLRAGIDQLNLSNSDYLAKPAAGFSYTRNFGDVRIGVDYAFMIEQYSPQDRHVIGINVNF
jgi:outer membrane protein W